MAVGIAELILLGLLFDWIARRLKLPGLIGLLCVGILAGPYALNLINAQTLDVAGDLRMIALVVILLRAGFEISRETLARVGVRALLLSFIPCILEAGAITVFAPLLLGFTYLEAAILGSVLGAVSPAVVVPLMVGFIKKGTGAKRGVPTLVLAGASCDDAVAIVLCTSLVGMYAGESVNLAWKLSSIPISIILGIAVGLIAGIVLYRFFLRFDPRATKRVLIILGLSLLLLHIQEAIHSTIPFAALLSIMATGFIILEKNEHMAHEISAKLGKIWVFAQLLLFTIVGMQVNIPVAINAGAVGALLIVLGLCGRIAGVQLSLLGSEFTTRERTFVSISYIPKATVQAAIGAVPLAAMKAAGMCTEPGEVILAIAVLSILITAPIGSIAIVWAGRNLLEQAQEEEPETSAQRAVIESE